MEKKNKTLIETLEAVHWKHFLLIYFILAGLPLIRPLAIPFPLDKQATLLYDYIENAPEGSMVLFDFCLSMSGLLIGGKIDEMVILQCMQNDLKLVMYSALEECPGPCMIVLDRIRPELDALGKVYGVDYVYFGFIPGEESVMAAIGTDAHSVLVRDFIEGWTTDEIPMMEDFRDYNDIDFVLVEDYTPKIHEAWIRQMPSKYGIDMLLLNGGPAYQAYFNAGLLKSNPQGVFLLPAYEKFMNRPGRGVITTDAWSMTNMYFLLMILIGNACYIYLRSSEKTGVT
jgi:hypothetical protein